MQDLLKNKFKIGGDAAAAAGPVGSQCASIDGLEAGSGVAYLFPQ